MIRFVEMKGVYLDKRKCFGFFNTVNNSFLNINDTYTFDSLKDFEDMYDISCGYPHQRLYTLIPEHWHGRR